ncbi:alpha-amylase family glycosyl hydrolase [Pleomorphovibrio marinus]|uniref:alpha-amylase family glycosyl hydrolase n=1 Tax=Pleomorphovibrio marinus TaxID=2164132 RepID=UPI000E0CA29B|nr:alpha-amylase family glycosyl hydrolase [Pleomorphovibrio marinus]
MKRTLYLLFGVFALFFSSNFVEAQVSTEPQFPSAGQEVKIYYDASEGTTGLEGADQVYIHIGAVTQGPESTEWDIVPFTWGSSNPEARMQKVEGESDLWTYSLTPNEFFDTGAVTIYRLGMVFRNADGSREGKTDTNQDFFIDLSQGFEVAFTKPQSSSLLLTQGESIHLIAAASQVADLYLEIDGIEVLNMQEATQLEYTFLGKEPRTYIVKVIGQLGEERKEAQIAIIVTGENTVSPVPGDWKRGINYLSDTQVGLLLEAPGKQQVFVIGDFNDWQVKELYKMHQSPDGNLFWLEIGELIPGEPYIFQYFVDGNVRIGDPYSEKVSDPLHDEEIIRENRYPGLRPYPEGKTTFQASYLQTAQQPFPWKHLDYEKPAPEELVIYELLVRDFDEQRTYQAVTERLDYLQELGINAIELLPIKEFEGNLSWGYNPSFFFAPDKYYGTKDDLKTLIDEAHGRGMVVILDMVLNHAFGQSPLVRLYNEGDYGPPTEENPYLNRVARHPFNVGYDFNHESSFTKAFVDSVNHYWLEEYKFDGYRFDLSKGFTQFNSGDDVDLWSQRDPSRIAIWKGIYDRIKSTHPDAYVILEHFANNDEETELADYGMLLWGNMNGLFREMGRGASRNFNGAYYQTRNWSKNHLVAYMESHDEERVMFDILQHGNTSPLNLRNLSDAVNRKQLLTAFYFTVPGPKMIWQFGEFGYDEELNNDRLGIKPTRWEYLEDKDRNRLWNLYKAMIQLKKSYPVFNSAEQVTMDLTGLVKQITLRHEGMDVVVFGNFSLSDQTNVFIDFPSSGTWYDYLTGEELRLSSASRAFDLAPNAFYIFTNQPIPLPEGDILQTDLITHIKQYEKSETKIYPVPAGKAINLELPLNQRDRHYTIFDLQGRVMQEGELPREEKTHVIPTLSLKKGAYLLQVQNGNIPLRKIFLKD